MEPAGPSTVIGGQDRRIPEGVYNLKEYSSNKFPDTFVLYNENVSEYRKILYHVGNYGSDTEGCNLPGTNKGNGAVYGSTQKFKELHSFIKQRGASNVKTIINN